MIRSGIAGKLNSRLLVPEYTVIEFCRLDKSRHFDEAIRTFLARHNGLEYKT